jgi:hypothetical protein
VCLSRFVGGRSEKPSNDERLAKLPKISGQASRDAILMQKQHNHLNCFYLFPKRVPSGFDPRSELQAYAKGC